MPATILRFERRQPVPDLNACFTAVDPPAHSSDGQGAPTPPSPRQIAHRWAMLTHLTRREGETPPRTLR